MPITSTVTVGSHIMTEILQAAALAPLRPRSQVITQLVNASNIDGAASLSRKIARRNAVADAYDQAEGVAVSSYASFAYDTAITLTPTEKVQAIAPTVRSLRRRMPGATYDQVIAALEAANGAAFEMLVEISAEILASHNQRLERDTLALFPSSGSPVGTSGAALSFATVLLAKTDVLDENPEHMGLALVTGQRGFSDLQGELVSATTGLASLWGSGIGDAFVSAIGGAEQVPAVDAAANVFGLPVYVVANDLMATANAGADRVSAVLAVGRGMTGMPGSLRGFAEICEGHAPRLTLELDGEANVAKAIGRWEWDLGIHTADHCCPIVSDF